MAITFGFYDSLDGDRQYTAETFSTPFTHIIEEGVFANYGEQLRVESEGGRDLRVRKGAAWCLGTWTRVDGPEVLTVEASDPNANRVDLVVLRHDKRVSQRRNYLMVIKGVPNGGAILHDGTDGTRVKDLVLARISVPKGAVNITDANITNVVGTETTPYVTAPLTSVDVSPLIQKYDDAFEGWFESIRDQLSGDVGANLANRITQLVKKDEDLAKEIQTVANSLKTDTDTGWHNLVMASGWRTVTYLRGRVLNGVLYINGVVAPTNTISATRSVGVPIAVFPTVIKDAIVGWGSGEANYGNAVSTTGFYAGLYVSKSIVGINYRNRNPLNGEFMVVGVPGALI